MASTSTGPVLWAPSNVAPTPDHPLLWPRPSYLGNGISRTSVPPGGSRDRCPQMSFDNCGGAGDGLARNSWSRGPTRPKRPTTPLWSKEGDEVDLPTLGSGLSGLRGWVRFPQHTPSLTAVLHRAHLPRTPTHTPSSLPGAVLISPAVPRWTV